MAGAKYPVRIQPLLNPPFYGLLKAGYLGRYKKILNPLEKIDIEEGT
ncbi:hypothetical protein G9Q97_13720 [Cyclobacterium sp. GBPx2]|uniref:Uncharacterized protein n=1 Tax=Cyclobacterium plantarum TaxID=2716263 RepID=A0ABX0H7W6_9BACT|nr:hypothetical protein [Cyclobacterium plantarum]